MKTFTLLQIINKLQLLKTP